MALCDVNTWNYPIMVDECVYVSSEMDLCFLQHSHLSTVAHVVFLSKAWNHILVEAQALKTTFTYYGNPIGLFNLILTF